MHKLKNLFKRILGTNTIIYKLSSKIYHFMSNQKYKITHKKETKIQNQKYNRRVNEAVEVILSYTENDYIIFYNPTWLGVAASTKGLFKNIVPLEQVFGKRNIRNFEVYSIRY